MTESILNDNTTTVIIPTHNAGQYFSDLLDSLQVQTLRPTQIIVVDSGSVDETCKIAMRKGCKVITISRTEFDHGSTRNLPLSDVKTEFVTYLTQDAIPANQHLIAELIKPMQATPNIAICYGRQLPKSNARPIERLLREFNYPSQSILKTKNDIETLGLKTFFCSNSCSAVRRSIFNKLGRFKNKVIVNEDMLFAANAIHQGYFVYYSAAAKVYHSHSYSLLQTFRRHFNIGRFFANNKWLLKQASLKRYSGDLIKFCIKLLWQKRAVHYIIFLLIKLVTKVAACKLGWYYQLLFGNKRDAHL